MRLERRRTDVQFLIDVLADGGWHSNTEILRRSVDERGVGMTVHSRISDVRKRGERDGFTVEHRRVDGERGDAYQYRLRRAAALAEPETRTTPHRQPVPVSASAQPARGGAPDPRAAPRRSEADVVFLLEREGFKELTQAELDELGEYEQASLFEAA
jgi:hypothetical protein